MPRCSTDHFHHTIVRAVAVTRSISSEQAKKNKNIKHDILLPISRIAEFIAVTDALLRQHFQDCRNVTFGHLGDGDLHCNVSPALEVSEEPFIARQAEINRMVHNSVDSMGGSILAEHEPGALKREEILRYKSSVEIALVKTIKQALDPLQLMNPIKVIYALKPVSELSTLPPYNMTYQACMRRTQTMR